MRIEELKLDNFAGIHHLSAMFDDRVMVLGNNRSGKTTALNAIRALLLGSIIDRNGKSVQLDNWIGPFGKSAGVGLVMEMDGRYKVAMEVKKSVSIEVEPFDGVVWSGSVKEIRAMLARKAGLTAPQLACSLNPQAYLLGDELGMTIAKMGGSSISDEQLSFLGDNMTRFHEYANAVGIAPDSIKNLLKIGAAMFEQRTGLNAKQNELAREIASLGDVKAPFDKNGNMLSAEKLPEIESAIATLRKKRDDLHRELGKYDAPAIDTEALTAKGEALGGYISAALEKFSVAKDAACRASDSLEHAENELRLLNQECAQKQLEAKRVTTERNALASRIEKMGKSNTCPTCGQAIPEKAFAAMTDTENLAHLDGVLCSLREEIDKINENIAKQQNVLSEKRESASCANRESDAAEKDLNRLTDERDRITTIIASAVVFDVPRENIERSISDIDQSITKAVDAKIALEKIKQRTEMESRALAVRDQIAFLSEMIPLFHNDKKSNHASALNEIGGNAQVEFVDRCNEFLNPFDIQIQLNTSGKSVNVEMLKPCGVPVPIAQVSGAEMLLAELAVSVGFGCDCPILLDEFTRLDGAYRATALEIIRELDRQIIFACAYGHNNSPDLEAIKASLSPIGIVWTECCS